jgi:hypothetical protein
LSIHLSCDQPLRPARRLDEADADVPQEIRGWIDKQFLTVREPLLETILTHGHGGLAGSRQRDVELTGVNAMLVSFGGEGSDLHGEPLLENVREVWND